MSTDICTIKNTGSRNVDLSLTRYWGGEKGICVQITGETEEGSIGYVQLSVQDIISLVPLLQEYIVKPEAERKNKEADRLIKEHKDLKKSIVSDVRDVSRMLSEIKPYELASLLLYGKQEIDFDEEIISHTKQESQ